MNKKDVENKISKSFTNATPQIYNNIQRDVANKTVNRAQTRAKRNTNLFWKLATGILTLVLVITAVIGIANTVGQTASASAVELDVNPSVKIQLNRRNRVVKVTALNSDGKIIIGDMDFNGCQLKVAVNALIGSMLRNGYLSAEANSVLVSVDSKARNYQDIANTVADAITVTLGQMQIDASVVSQWIKSDDAISAIAKNYGVSTGKAQLIYNISSKSEYSVEQLAELSVNDLSVILSELNIDLDDIDKQGTASKDGYIGDENAKKIAFNLAEENLAEVSNAECKLVFKDGRIMYEVEFVYGDFEYEIEVAAKNGEVITFTKELIIKHVPADSSLTKEQIEAVALSAANVEKTQTENFYSIISRYYRVSVYEISFVANDTYYEFEIASDGTILYQGYELLKVSEVNSYLARKDVDKWFLQNNKDGITALNKLERYRVTTQKTNDGLTYTIQFVSNDMQYTYKIDAVNRKILSREVVEYENAVKENIKDKLYYIFGSNDIFHGGANGDWNDWDLSDWNFDDDEYNWEFEQDGYRYEVEIDRWGNVKYEQKVTNEEIIAQIKQAIADELNCEVDEITVKEVELKFNHGMQYYEIEFIYNGEEYEGEIEIGYDNGFRPNQPPAHRYF